jgi:hypothetical protein
MMCKKLLVLIGLVILAVAEGPSIKVEGTRAGGFSEIPLEQIE